MADKGQDKEISVQKTVKNTADLSNFVFDKSIFSNVFEKDVRRIYIYKKAERLAKAIHLIGPAFAESPSLKDRLDKAAMGLVDAAVLAPSLSKEVLSRELLTLSSILSIAQTSGLLSSMNAEIIAREAHQLLAEIASYEEPHVLLEEIPSLATLAKMSLHTSTSVLGDLSYPRATMQVATPAREQLTKDSDKGRIRDTIINKDMSDKTSGRRDNILSILRSKGPSYIKDISMVIRDISEKTIQRELSTLVSEGKIVRKGDRRWTTYEVVSE